MRRGSVALVIAVVACAPVSPAAPEPTGPASPAASVAPAATPSPTRPASLFVVGVPPGVPLDLDRIRAGAAAIARRNGLELIDVTLGPGRIAFVLDREPSPAFRSEIEDLVTLPQAPSRSASPPPPEAATGAEAAARRVLQSVVLLFPPAGTSGGRGAGFFISRDGHLITNAHVARDMPRPMVTLYDGRTLSGRVVGFVQSGEPDIAVIKVDVTDAPAVEFGDSDAARAGDAVLKIGHPGGYGNWIVTGGKLLAPGTAPVRLRADTPGAPGDSGGPLFDARGRVVGVVYGGSSEGRLSSPAPFRIIWSWAEFDATRVPPATDVVPINVARAKAAEIVAKQGNVP